MGQRRRRNFSAVHKFTRYTIVIVLFIIVSVNVVLLRGYDAPRQPSRLFVFYLSVYNLFFILFSL